MSLLNKVLRKGSHSPASRRLVEKLNIANKVTAKSFDAGKKRGLKSGRIQGAVGATALVGGAALADKARNKQQ